MTELETALTGISVKEERLADHRKEIQDALRSIETGIAVLSDQPISGKQIHDCHRPKVDVARNSTAHRGRVA
jgi:hypothetical protein